MDFRLLIILLPLACSNLVPAQEPPSPGARQAARADKLSRQYIASVGAKSDQAINDIDRQTQKYLDKLQRQEAKLQKKLAKIDSLAAHNIFANSADKYQQLQNDIKNKSEKLQRSTGRYNSWLDTSLNSIKFLAANPLAGKIPVSPSQLKEAIGKLRGLEAQLNETQNVKEFIRRRKDYLSQQLKQYNLGKELDKYKEQCFYFNQQVADIQADLSDESKIERRALSTLRQLPAFSVFMKKYGFLSSLFDVPADYASTSVNGLQTISQTQNLLQSRINNMGPGGAQAAEQSISAAQSELSRLRNRFPQFSNTGDLPDGFQPSQVKTRPLKKRLVYGVDMTTAKNNLLLPVTSNIGLSIGYRATDRLTAGVGMGYKMGWGPDIRHIRLSSEGLNFRSYADWKISKRGFFFSAGAEWNYLSQFKNIQELKDYTAWSKSILGGVSKTLSLKSKVFKGTKIFLGYDFLHAMQVPKGNALLFRAGYSF